MLKVLFVAFVLAFTASSIAVANPGTYTVIGRGSSAAPSGAAVSAARDEAIAQAARACDRHANPYLGNSASLNGVHIVSSHANKVDATYVADVEVSAKCFVTR